MKEFKGQNRGVRLVPRGENDPHVCFELLGEDDGNWFNSNGASSFWLPELIDALQSAQSYMEYNCQLDIVNGKKYGYKFKPEITPPNPQEFRYLVVGQNNDTTCVIGYANDIETAQKLSGSDDLIIDLETKKQFYDTEV